MMSCPSDLHFRSITTKIATGMLLTEYLPHARYWVRHVVTYIISEPGIVIPILHIRKLSLREISALIQRHVGLEAPKPDSFHKHTHTLMSLLSCLSSVLYL